MKSALQNIFLAAFLFGFFIYAYPLTAQTINSIHAFAGSPDGVKPQSKLISSGDRLYGTTVNGGTNGNGALFVLDITGTSLKILHSFAVGALNSIYIFTNIDGISPCALTLSGDTLYGIAQNGGINGSGNIFSVKTNGSNFTILHNFSASIAFLGGGPNSDGISPRGLLLAGNALYGTTVVGGSAGNGTLFAINPDGTDFQVLYVFSSNSGYSTNYDGATPQAGLVLSSNLLYGTAATGGTYGKGTVFVIATNGSGFITLHSFSGVDGFRPYADLLLQNGASLYGATQNGGSNGYGTTFKSGTTGTNFTSLYSFNGTNDGASLYAGLIQSGSFFYGTAFNGGANGNGTIFAINTAGTVFTNLYNFTGGMDGANPYAGLTLVGNTLYGTASAGGTNNNGTIFSLTLPLPPPLEIVLAGGNVILTWPTNVAGYVLQSAFNLLPPVTWNAVTPPPVVVNGQNTVTNPLAGTQQFYRLSQ